MGEKEIAPQICPHCGNTIKYLKPVGQRTLDAARAVAHGSTISANVAAALGIRPSHAAILLRRAEKAGIIAIVQREKLESNGGARFRFEPTIRLRAYDPIAYKTWRNAQKLTRHNKAA